MFIHGGELSLAQDDFSILSGAAEKSIVQKNQQLRFSSTGFLACAKAAG
jgi:hypothetical protein